MFNHFHHKLLSLFSSAIPISKALVFWFISSLVISLFRTKMMSGAGGESTTIDIEARSASKGKGPVMAVHRVKEEKGGMERGMAIIDLVLRIGAIVASLAAAATMGTSDQNLPFFTQFFQFEASYDDMPSFQFFLIAMSLVAGYLVLSLPFSIVCIVRAHASGPRLLLLILDLVALTLATSAAGAATSIVYLAHNGNANSNWLAICNQFGDFCKNVSGAVVASFVTVVTFMFLILLSALALRKHH